MSRLSLRTRLIVGLIAVVAVGLGAAEVLTYYSVRSFLLERVDEQVEAASGPAITRLLVEDRFRGPGRGQFAVGEGPGPGQVMGGPATGIPRDITASVPPGTYAEVRFANGEPRATSFGFESSYPVPEIPDEFDTAAPALYTVHAAGSTERFRLGVTRTPDGEATLFVAVPLTEFDSTMARLRLIGGGVTAGVLLLVAVIAFWLVRLGLRPLDEFAATASRISAGDLTGRMPVANPHTEIGRLGNAMNDMLEDLEESFAQRDRSEEQLRRFLADASHELRTPLTSIRGYAELFGRGASVRPDDLQKVMDRISQQSERMSHIVEDLLLLARLDRGRPLATEVVDLSILARDVVDDARHREPGRSISFAAGEQVRVIGDPDRLYQVVNNLVTNALAHTPPAADVEVSIVREGASALLRVRDTGPGIPDEDRPHVFEPFYRASAGRARKDGGSGLGLAIVQAIVEAHEGNVSVAPSQPHGATFAVTLPAAS